ncbi:MAG TPA: DmsC/YnfH family molybdoenzyme membrane anchor subunit [Acidimicrobiales bacterium]
MTEVIASPVTARAADAPARPLTTLVDDYLARHRDLSAVERFGQRHADAERPLHERWYRDLLPATPPGPGQQYRFEVDLDACTGCKSCVAACHALNGLDEGESWRSVGTLQGANGTPVLQTVTTACHHCVEPACLAGCPVDAYEKDPVTGIVRHLDDQCIGCSYCTFTCPYEVPRFNERLGVVRKCDMCAGRLAAGEAPACAQACPTGAIAIGVVDTSELVAAATETADAALVPGAPPSAVTVPSTAYRRRRPLPPDAHATDRWSEVPRAAHRPLVAMLVLTQVAVGALVAHLGAEWLLADTALAGQRRATALLTALTGLVALGASVFHLGRPRYAWRAVLGLRHSWLSREVVAFGAFGALSAAYAASTLWPGGGGGGAGGSGWPPTGLVDVVRALAAASGVAGVACSVLVYTVTGRRWWRPRRTASAFLATAATGGLAALLALVTLSGVADGDPAELDRVVPPVGAALAGASALVLAAEAAALVAGRRGGRLGGPPDAARSAALLVGPLARTTTVRFAAGAVGGVVVPAALAAADYGPPAPPRGLVAGAGVAALALVVMGELAARTLFFRAELGPRMPGVPR